MLGWRTIIRTLVSGMITMRSTSSIFSWKCFNCTRKFVPNLLPNWIHKIFTSDFWEMKWFLQFCNKELNKHLFSKSRPEPLSGLSADGPGVKPAFPPECWKIKTMDKWQSEDNESHNYKFARTYPAFRAGTNLRVL